MSMGRYAILINTYGIQIIADEQYERQELLKLLVSD